jgi:hypothetical protein
MAITYTKGTPLGLSMEMLVRDAVERRVNIIIPNIAEVPRLVMHKNGSMEGRSVEIIASHVICQLLTLISQ